MREVMKEIVKKQFEKEYNCTSNDFINKKTIITDLELKKGSRVYSTEEEILKLLIFNDKVVISTNESLKEWCYSYLAKIPPEWMFLYSVLRKIDAKLNEYGYEIDNAHHYYLPKDGTKEKIYDDISLRWYEKEEIEQFRINGMAGASEDSDLMWQIGINVFPGSEGKGIATKLVTALKAKIIRRGKVPFYGTAESHIISQKVAIASGFEPAFAELKVRRKK